MYKTKALLDRRYDLRSAGSNPFIESKIWKDFYDMAILMKKSKIDVGFLKELLKQNKFAEHIVVGLELLAERKDIIEIHGTSDAIKNLLEGIKA